MPEPEFDKKDVAVNSVGLTLVVIGLLYIILNDLGIL